MRRSLGKPGGCALLVGIVLGCLAVPQWSVVRLQVRVTDTTLSVQPSKGSPSTTFTATLTYEPKQAACPPSTEVDFTWDGAPLGSSEMQGSVEPCRATLTTKPLAGNVAVGEHQVCGKFSFSGTHKGCAPFTIQSASQPHPVYSTTYSTRYYTTYTTTHPRTSTTYDERSTARSSSSDGGSAQAAPPGSGGGGGVATNSIVGAALAAVLLFGIRAIIWSRRHATYRR
jgi:hypothetical protein